MYVKAIEGLWQDQGFVPVSELYYEDPSGRRTTFESYAAGVDWPDVAHVERSLRYLSRSFAGCPARIGTGHLVEHGQAGGRRPAEPRVHELPFPEVPRVVSPPE